MRRGARAILPAITAAICSTGCQPEDPQSRVGQACVSVADCSEISACVAGRCHMRCESSDMCAADSPCARVERTGVCLLAEEQQCSEQGECPEGLVCAADEVCRNECAADRECLSGQACADGTCADPIEPEDGGDGGDAEADDSGEAGGASDAGGDDPAEPYDASDDGV